MSKLLNLLSNLRSDTARAYQSLQVFRLGATVLLSIILVKSGFSKEGIGNFEWFIFLANGLSFFWSLGLKNAFMSYFPKLEEHEKSSLIFNVFILFIGLGLILSAVAHLTPSFNSSLGGLDLLLLSLFMVLGVSASLVEHIFIVNDQAKQLFNYGLISFLGYLVLLGGGAIMYGDITLLIRLLIFWASLRFLYALILISRNGSFHLDFSLMARFFLFGFPLILHVLLGGGMEYVDGYLVDTFYTRSDFTVFRYGARELPINTVFISGLASAAIPFAVANLTQTLSDIKIRLTKLMHWLFPISIVLVLISPMIFRLVYSSEYLESADIFNVYLLIICSRILLPQVVIYAQHKNKILMWVAIIELFINISLSLLLMRYWGMIGIAVATVIAYLVQKGMLIIYNKNKLNVSLREYLEVKVYLIYSIALYVAFGASLVIY